MAHNILQTVNMDDFFIGNLDENIVDYIRGCEDACLVEYLNNNQMLYIALQNI